MKRPSLGLAMIMKNEEENLPGLFASIKDCFDEVHLTDTGSTDNSVEIAKSLGATVHHFDWINDFGAARNKSFEPVTTDYVMWLDCDDVLQDRESFLRFRDDAMGLADYWLAKYIYASTPDGKPACTFDRERVFKNKAGFQWKYPIHEGVLPKFDLGTPRISYSKTWAVKHMRTEADLLKDRSRNLLIFEDIKKKQKLDSRLLHYYGKELYEAKKPIEAIQAFGEALSQPDLELHDRTLAMQYLCYCYMECNQYPKAIDLAMTGIQLCPNRAEFYVIVGDSYLKAGRPNDSIPFFEAARKCVVHVPMGMAGPLFNHTESYGAYPTAQLAAIHIQQGNLDQGEKEAQLAKDVYNSPHGDTLLNDAKKIRQIINGYKNAKPCQDIVFTTPPQTAYTFDPILAKEKAMGGSETALMEMAHHMAQITGRPVKVFNMRERALTVDGVEYLPVNQVNYYMAENEPALHIAWRHNNKLTNAPTYLWCHDLTTMGCEATENYEKMLCLTPFHKRYVMAMNGVPEDKIWVTRNGIKPERFQDGPWEKDPFRFVYSSSPDRGLDRCMLVLDRVRETYPQITLHVHYGIEHLHKYGLGDLQTKLRRMLDERQSWVTYHGATQQDELMKSFKQSAYNVQPSDWIETSMISANELVCTGVYPIIRAIGGAVDTLAKPASEGMASLVDSECLTQTDYQRFIDETILAIQEERYKRVNVNAEELSWKKVAQEWVDYMIPVSSPITVSDETTAMKQEVS